MVMPGLLLQKPHTKAGSKDFKEHFTHCLALWKAGRVRELVNETHTIQSMLPTHDNHKGLTTHKLNRRLASLTSKGNIRAAISLIPENKGGVLDLTPVVCSTLKSKHPQPQPANLEV